LLVPSPRVACLAEGRPVRRMRRSMCFVFLLFTIHSLLFTVSSEAEIFDRVVAFVDDQAITLSELQEQLEIAKKVSKDITEEEVLDTMINRVLLWRQAKKYRIEAPTRDEMIDEYIDLKVRAFTKISETEVEEFYKKNQDKFAGKTYDEVRDEIEKYLTEKELNSKLKNTLKELRENAYVKIQLSREQ
jgi:predicted ArsR family transcriptional regulator